MAVLMRGLTNRDVFFFSFFFIIASHASKWRRKESEICYDCLIIKYHDSYKIIWFYFVIFFTRPSKRNKRPGSRSCLSTCTDRSQQLGIFAGDKMFSWKARWCRFLCVICGNAKQQYVRRMSDIRKELCRNISSSTCITLEWRFYSNESPTADISSLCADLCCHKQSIRIFFRNMSMIPRGTAEFWCKENVWCPNERDSLIIMLPPNCQTIKLLILI